MPEPKITEIQGKPYETVDSRVARFNADHHEGGAIETEMLYCDENRVVFKASVYMPGRAQPFTATPKRPRLKLHQQDQRP